MPTINIYHQKEHNNAVKIGALVGPKTKIKNKYNYRSAQNLRNPSPTPDIRAELFFECCYICILNIWFS